MANKVFIAIDGSDSSIPVDLKQHVEQLPHFVASARNYSQENSGTVLPQTENVLLDRWDIQCHQYETSAQVSASILAKIISANANMSSFGVVQEAKCYRVDKTKEGSEIEFGTAVRLSVALSTKKFDASLTIPNIAATAQLSDARARVSLSVVGYTGHLGQLLPAPDDLNVENLPIYLQAFKSIQAEVFGEKGKEYISPTILGYFMQETAV